MVELKLYSWVTEQVEYVQNEHVPDEYVKHNHINKPKTWLYIKNYPSLSRGQRMLYLGGRLFVKWGKGYTREVWLKIE